MRAVLLFALAALLCLPSGAADPPATRAAYIGGSHTIVGSVNNVPVFGSVPVSTAMAVCQQNVQMPLVPVHVTSPSVGGACGVLLPSSTVSVVVQDSQLGLLAYEYEPVDASGTPCGASGTASSGAVLDFAEDCVGLSVWPDVRATYGTITLTAA